MSFTDFNWVDYLIVLLLVASIVISIVRGFAKEALSLASWILAFGIGLTFYSPISELLVNYIDSESIRLGVAFITLVVAILIIGSIINYLILQFVQDSGLKATDRCLGVVFGVARAVLIVCLFMMIGVMFALDNDTWWQDSVLIESLSPVADWLKSFMPEAMEKP